MVKYLEMHLNELLTGKFGGHPTSSQLPRCSSTMNRSIRRFRALQAIVLHSHDNSFRPEGDTGNIVQGTNATKHVKATACFDGLQWQSVVSNCLKLTFSVPFLHIRREVYAVSCRLLCYENKLVETVRTTIENFGFYR